MTSRYLIDIENRKSKIIHVYRNGDKYNRAALVLLRPIEQQKLERIFKAIEEKLTLTYNKPIKRIFTLKGKEIDDPFMVKDQKYYVVGSSENFINTRYGSIIKWSIIGPVKWSKFTDVFYESREQDDLMMGNKVLYQWKNTTPNSARFSSKMTKSMSAYPTDRKITKSSKIMTLSMDQSKRPISEPSNDMKTTNETRNQENGYFHSSDDRNSSGDNSETSPKIISSNNQRSMDQFLNDSLKMYQLKDNTKNENENGLNISEKIEIKSEHDDDMKEHEIISLTNIIENPIDNELDKENNAEFKDILKHDSNEFEKNISDEISHEISSNINNEPEILNKSEDNQSENDNQLVEMDQNSDDKWISNENDISENKTSQDSEFHLKESNGKVGHLNENINDDSQSNDEDLCSHDNLLQSDVNEDISINEISMKADDSQKNASNIENPKENFTTEKIDMTIDLSIKDDEISETTESKEFDSVDNYKDQSVDFENKDETINDLNSEKDHKVEYNYNENEQESLHKENIPNLQDENNSYEINNSNNEEIDYSKSQLSEEENNKESLHEILSGSQEIYKISNDNVIGNANISGLVESNSNQDTDESDMELDKNSEIFEENASQHELSKSASSKKDDDDDDYDNNNKSNNEDEIQSNYRKNNFESSKEENHFKNKDGKCSDILNSSSDNEDNVDLYRTEKQKENNVEISSENDEQMENENSEQILHINKNLGKFKEREIDSETSSKVQSDNEKLEDENSDYEDHVTNKERISNVKVSSEDINKINESANESQEICDSEKDDDPDDSSIKIHSDENENFQDKDIEENRRLSSPNKEIIELDIENEDLISEKSNHDLDENIESKISLEKSDNVEIDFNPKEQYDRIDIQSKDSTEFEEDHNLLRRDLSNEKIQEINCKNSNLEQFNRIDFHQDEPPNCIESVKDPITDNSDNDSRRIDRDFKDSIEEDHMEQYNRIDMTLEDSVHCIPEKHQSLTDVSDNENSEIQIGDNITNFTDIAEEDKIYSLDKRNLSISDISDNESQKLNETNEDTSEIKMTKNTEISSEFDDSEYEKNKSAPIIQKSFRKDLEKLDSLSHSENLDSEKEIDSDIELKENEDQKDIGQITDNSENLINSQKVDEEDAAVMIQKNFRGYLARMDLEKNIKHSNSNDNMELEIPLNEKENNCDEKIDSENLNQLPNEKDEQDNAARIIQKSFRGHMVRKELIDHNKQLDIEEDSDSEGKQHRSYDPKDSEDENDPDVNLSLTRDATNDLNTEDILDDHSQLDNIYSDDAFALNNKF